MKNIMNSPLLVLALSLVALWLSTRIGIVFRQKRKLEEDNHEDFVIIVSATLTMLALASLTVPAGPHPEAGPVVVGAGVMGGIAVRVPRRRRPPPDPVVGRRLRDRRVELGMSQERLAEGIVSVSYVSLIEAGRRTPEPDVLDRLAQRLDCSADYLRTGSAPRRN